MTLKELKKIVKEADTKGRVPSAKSLRNKKIVVKEAINAETEISVFENGYVLYQAGEKTTAFALHACGNYEYRNVTEGTCLIQEEFFDDADWYIRLVMEAEDRLALNQERVISNHKIFSYSDYSKEVKVIEQSEHPLDAVLDREVIRELMSNLTERQKAVIRMYFFDEMRQEDIADYLGVKQQSVYESLQRALKSMRKQAVS